MEKQVKAKAKRREEEDQRRERVRRKRMQARKKVEKFRSSKHYICFSAFSGSGRSKSWLAKAAGAEPSWGDEGWKIVRHCGTKLKTLQVRSTFGSWDVGKVHAVVARSTCRSQSQNVQNTPCSEHFWKLRCLKSARHCGAKHISMSKV